MNTVRLLYQVLLILQIFEIFNEEIPKKEQP